MGKEKIRVSWSEPQSREVIVELGITASVDIDNCELAETIRALINSHSEGRIQAGDVRFIVPLEDIERAPGYSYPTARVRYGGTTEGESDDRGQ